MARVRGWYGPCHAKAESQPKEEWPDDINTVHDTPAGTTSIIQVSIGSESATLRRTREQTARAIEIAAEVHTADQKEGRLADYDYE